MNRYRVDRVKKGSMNPPAGMNGLLYIGDSRTRAYRIYREAKVGFDSWSRENPDYGISISEWNDYLQEYVILDERYIEEGVGEENEPE